MQHASTLDFELSDYSLAADLLLKGASMTFKTIALLLAAASLPAASIAQGPVATPPEFTPAAFRAHVTFLADDLLEGRDTGTRGYDIAANYVATRFQALGLQPVGPNGSYFQQVPFVRYSTGDVAPVLTIGGRAFENGSSVIVGPSATETSQTIEAPAVFAGYGLESAAHGLDDYAGLDVNGKIVVVLGGLPDGVPSDVAAHLGGQKAKIASDKGAVGLVTIPTRADMERRPFARLVEYAGHSGLTWVGPDGKAYSAAPNIRMTATLDTPAAQALFAGAPTSLDAVLDTAARKGGKPKGFALEPTMKLTRTSVHERITSPNVVAILPGSDPALADEYVLLMGHLDHVGTEPGKEGDQIFNGAMDNATGIATMLEAARAFVESGARPKRPILFAAVTAEEKGLLGAQYLAKNPVVKNGKVVAVVNLDMPVLLYDFVDVIGFGAEHSTMGPIVERAGARMGIKLIDDPLPQERLFTRSDHYRFVQEGVPSVFVMTGFGNGGAEKFTNFLKTNYHQPGDDVSQPIDWNAGAKFARLNYLIAREIADAPQAPRWYGDSFFGTTYAPGAAKATR